MKKRMCSFILVFLIIFSIVPNLALAAVPDDSVHTTVNGAAPVGRANNRIQLPFMAPDADTFISHESSDGMIDLGGSSEGVKRYTVLLLDTAGVQGSVIEVYTFDGEKVLEAKDGTPVYEYLDDHKEYVVRVTMPLNFGYRVSYNGVTTTLFSTNELVISLSSEQRNEFIITAPDLE